MGGTCRRSSSSSTTSSSGVEKSLAVIHTEGRADDSSTDTSLHCRGNHLRMLTCRKGACLWAWLETSEIWILSPIASGRTHGMVLGETPSLWPLALIASLALIGLGLSRSLLQPHDPPTREKTHRVVSTASIGIEYLVSSQP